MEYVIGIDLGTSSVKALLVDQKGRICGEAAESYPLIQLRSGYSEQDPELWINMTIKALGRLIEASGVDPEAVTGMSFSGQMHGLVLLDKQHRVLRHAILWNDTRTTAQCREIEAKLGDDLLKYARNPALEGFTLPKLLWVREHEPELFRQAAVFLLPKDYLRFRLTGQIAMDYSDAAGTLMLNVPAKAWSPEILSAFGIPTELCPPLVSSDAGTGTLLPEIAAAAGLTSRVKVFAGGADNACGAIGAGVLRPGDTLCSIGTSGVILSYEDNPGADYGGRLHFFNHGRADAFYAMGVTLAAGNSLTWFRDTFAPQSSFDELLEALDEIPPGAGGLLFTPYLPGERTPHGDASIRGSFIGLDSRHTRDHLVKAVVEGITFSLAESIRILREPGQQVESVISIGGGARNEAWLQIQADIFNAEVIRLESEQGPALGAAMLAACGLGWYASLEDCADAFVRRAGVTSPNKERVQVYEELFDLYRQVYANTQALSKKLEKYRG
ncbi:xylulokinase [Paenibacillus sp. J22TS3]|uniref:xylulokinase n=1 Tax=Paenibacillus sp. J22TS3 TaxID=2807192 RepID=UPI001B1EC5AE|nr:xylulokinase [Paenibacillus sp. J22TS3]GIP20603.1 xylulose kinase [Paenibacillus sp. J22TS3]